MTPFLRYTLVGACATALHYALLTTLVEWRHWPAPLAAVAGATAGALLAYAGNRKHTFTSDASHAQAVPRFAAVALLTAILSGGTVALGDRVGVHYLLAQGVASLSALLLGYKLNKRWSFA